MHATSQSSSVSSSGYSTPQNEFINGRLNDDNGNFYTPPETPIKPYSSRAPIQPLEHGGNEGFTSQIDLNNRHLPENPNQSLTPLQLQQFLQILEMPLEPDQTDLPVDLQSTNNPSDNFVTINLRPSLIPSEQSFLFDALNVAWDFLSDCFFFLWDLLLRIWQLLNQPREDNSSGMLVSVSLHTIRIEDRFTPDPLSSPRSPDTSSSSNSDKNSPSLPATSSSSSESSPTALAPAIVLTDSDLSSSPTEKGNTVPLNQEQTNQNNDLVDIFTHDASPTQHVQNDKYIKILERVNDKEKAIMKNILQTLAQESLIDLYQKEKSLEEWGNAIGHLHPFSFWIEVSKSEELTSFFNQIYNRTWEISIVYNTCVARYGDAFKHMHNHKYLLPFTEAVATLSSKEEKPIESTILEMLIKNESWEALIRYIVLYEIPQIKS